MKGWLRILSLSLIRECPRYHWTRAKQSFQYCVSGIDIIVSVLKIRFNRLNFKITVNLKTFHLWVTASVVCICSSICFCLFLFLIVCWYILFYMLSNVYILLLCVCVGSTKVDLLN